MSNHYNDIYYEDLYQQYEEWQESQNKIISFKEWEESLFTRKPIKSEAHEQKRSNKK